MIAHDSGLNGATSAPDPTSAPHTHPDASHRSTAHRSTSPGWRWTDMALVLVALAGVGSLIAGMIWALTTPAAVMHYESIEVRTERTVHDWTPGHGPALPAPIPMVLADMDDPRAVVYVPAWPTAVVR